MASAVTAAISTVAFPTEAATGTLLFRASLIDREAAAIKSRAIHSFDCFLRLFRRGHGDESKTARAASDPISHEVGLGDHAVRREGVLQIVFGGVEREIPNE